MPDCFDIDMPAGADNKVLDGRILLRQPVKGFRSGTDAVLLAAASHPRPGGKVLELGCGTGSAMLCLGWRRPDVSLTGLEIDPPTARLAAFNAIRNGMAGRTAVLCGDIAVSPAPPGGFDLVLANPPYFVEGRYRRSPDPDRDRARAETGASLVQWIAAAVAALKPGGEAVFILRAERTGEALAARPVTFDAEVRPVLGNPAKPAKRNLLRLRPGSGRVATLEPLRLHHQDGRETALAAAIFRHAAPVFWSEGPVLLASRARRDT
ncbi:MAG: tRNA1(Val) (adenine(37)-N6)-methyltransferase [Minwuia sp.]|uniref:tRNA1(Val) (adenine(37)-N6)-methyltransferase n=1 Tax=Minwuia sp. TaxID=2493630 RepID=UPI003A871236